MEALSNTFIAALESGDENAVAAVPKSDWHNHASNGGNVRMAGIPIPQRPDTFPSLLAMEEWAHMHIKQWFPKPERYGAAFAQAAADGVTVLAMSFITSELEICPTIGDFISVVQDLHMQYAPGVLFLPELAFFSGSDIALEEARLDEILSHNFFTSVDICGEENADAFARFKGIYRRARAAGLRLKAHAGEYGTADDVLAAAETLELDEVHHGIAAADSALVMQWLARNKIQLNVCPSSNIILGRVADYCSHPIRRLVDFGVPVTVNSDDMLIFDQSVSREYLNLFNCGLMTAAELDWIRRTGLRVGGECNCGMC